MSAGGTAYRASQESSPGRSQAERQAVPGKNQ